MKSVLWMLAAVEPVKVIVASGPPIPEWTSHWLVSPICVKVAP
jgi:hypothetical protein